MTSLRTATIFVATQIQPESLMGSGVPWWVILLAVLGGLLLLGLLAYGLYKVRMYCTFEDGYYSKLYLNNDYINDKV